MSTAAIICEYNPFHNGHKFQTDNVKKSLQADGVIAIMSGNFMQRGAPAICDKWHRAKMALYGGCDLVIELPTVFAAQSAERFAFGGVKLADSLGIVDYLSFGSECADLELLKRCAERISEDGVQSAVSEYLKSGMSYPLARAKAAGEEFSHVLAEPNNILAVEYIKALAKIKSSIVPVPLKREGCAHDSQAPQGSFASASYLRKSLKSGLDFEAFMPKEAAEILKNADKLEDESRLNSVITYLLRSTPPDKLDEIADMTEGLQYRFCEAARQFSSFEEISQLVKTKRYTKTRIDRILINILLWITKEDINAEPQYIRVLGLNDKGKELLSGIKKKSSLPIITKVKDARLSPQGEKMLRKDIFATDIYSLILSSGKSGLDYTTSPVVRKLSCM